MPLKPISSSLFSTTTMSFPSVAILSFLLSLISSSAIISAQQLYVGKTTTDCTKTDNSALGYSCNGLNRSCQSYLIFRSLPPYNTAASISALLGSNPSQVSAINSVSSTQTLATNRLIIVPVTCSCSGNHYQANTSYAVQLDNSYFSIANNTYQGLSTCQAIQNQNVRSSTGLSTGERLAVPLRCACPTKNQTDVGIKYLLSYLVTFDDTVELVSTRFDVETARSLEANGLSLQNAGIYPFTTLLIPLQDPPTSLQTDVPSSPPISSAPPPPSVSPTSNNGSKKTWVYVLVGALSGAVVVAIFSTAIFFVLFRGRRKRSESDSVIVSESFEAQEKPLNKKLEEESEDFLESASMIAKSIKVYKFQELQAATDNFSPLCCIKGLVYRGVINGDYAAIKKMNGDVTKEINLLSNINHSNLIRLSGVCFSDGNWYLVYEYAANGPLSDWIFGSNMDGKYLSWSQRLQIASDVAMGLNYLHSFTNFPHVHKDIKCSNVLVDSDLRAKIANFSLARPTDGLEGEFALTRHIVGTKGYMSPEYLENGLVSTKLDVYAFGVLVLEMITGKEVAALYPEETMSLFDMLSVVLSQENGHESVKALIDPSMQGNYSQELAVFVIRIIQSCLSKNPADRPAMDELVSSLSNPNHFNSLGILKSKFQPEVLTVS